MVEARSVTVRSNCSRKEGRKDISQIETQHKNLDNYPQLPYLTATAPISIALREWNFYPIAWVAAEVKVNELCYHPNWSITRGVSKPLAFRKGYEKRGTKCRQFHEHLMLIRSKLYVKRNLYRLCQSKKARSGLRIQKESSKNLQKSLFGVSILIFTSQNLSELE